MFFSRCKPQKKKQMLLCVGGSYAGKYVRLPKGDRTFEIRRETRKRMSREGWVELWETETYRLHSIRETISQEEVSFLVSDNMDLLNAIQELFDVYAGEIGEEL